MRQRHQISSRRRRLQLTLRPAAQEFSVSQLKPLQGAKPISVADNPVLRDLMATNWLMTHGANAT